MYVTLKIKTNLNKWRRTKKNLTGFYKVVPKTDLNDYKMSYKFGIRYKQVMASYVLHYFNSTCGNRKIVLILDCNERKLF